MGKHILCIDPGKTTGWCLLRVTKDSPTILVSFGEVPGQAGNLWHLWNHTIGVDPDLIVAETWEYRHGTPTDARHACEPLGMMKLIAYGDGVPFVEQWPRDRNSIPDTRAELEPFGWWIPGQKRNKPSALNPEGLEGHARQALRHGVRYVVHTLKHRPTIDALLAGV